MLGITPKHSEDVDLVRPINDFLSSNFSKDEVKGLNEAVREINGRRHRVVQVSKSPGSDLQTAINYCMEYLADLDLLSTRFVFGRHQGSSFFRTKVDTIMVPFTWYDTHRTNKKGSDYSVKFEIAAVVFNVGCLHSMAGIAEDRSTQPGLVSAAKHFQAAAGAFTYLSTNPEFESPATLDMSGHSYRLMTHFMLAQSQACFFEQAVKKKMSPGLIAKLASGTAGLFHHAYRASSKNPLKDWLLRSSYKWTRHMSYQNLCFTAASHFWLAKAALDKSAYGEEIAHLYRAKDVCSSAQQQEDGLIRGLAESRKRLYEMIVTRLAAALKDNETIYHYVIPPQAELKNAEAKLVVKATPFEMPGGGAGNGRTDDDGDRVNPFNQLVPIKVHEDASLFVQQLTTAVSEIQRDVQEAADTAKMHLASQGLPGSLEAMEIDQGVPASATNRLREVQFQGGVDVLSDLVRQVSELREQAWEKLREIRKLLEEEATEDERCRNKFGPSKWNRIPSSQITAAFHRDAQTVEQFLTAAGQSDIKISDDLTAKKEELGILSMTVDDISAMMPSGAEVNSAKTQASEELHRLLDELSGMIDQRGVLLKKLEEEVGKANIVPALLAAEKKETTEQVFRKEKKQYEPLQKEIADSLDKQKDLLDKITIANTEFVKSKDQSEAISAREQVLQRLNNATNLFDRLLANLNEGIKFYSDIARDYLHPLRQTIDDFLLARDEEKRLLLQQLSRVSAGYNGNGNGGSGSGSDGGAGNANEQKQAYQPSVDSEDYSNSFANNPNVLPPTAPVYPSQMGYGRIGSIDNSSNNNNNSNNNSASVSASSSSSSSSGSADGAKWSCPSCTFQNRYRAMVCEMCNTDNPSPPPPISVDQTQQQQQQQQQQGKKSGWRGFFS